LRTIREEALSAAEAEVHAERRRCIEIRRRSCLRGRGRRDRQSCAELLILAPSQRSARTSGLAWRLFPDAEIGVLRTQPAWAPEQHPVKFTSYAQTGSERDWRRSRRAVSGVGTRPRP